MGDRGRNLHINLAGDLVGDPVEDLVEDLVEDQYLFTLKLSLVLLLFYAEVFSRSVAIVLPFTSINVTEEKK